MWSWSSEVTPWCLPSQHLPPTAHSKPAAPSSWGEPVGAVQHVASHCSSLPQSIEAEWELLDHLRSCVLSCTLLYLTYFQYICFEFTNPFIKNKWQYDAVHNAVFKNTLSYLVLCIYIYTHIHVNPHATYTCISLFHETPIMTRANRTSPSPETYSANICHLDIHASMAWVILTTFLLIICHRFRNSLKVSI